MGKVIFPHCLLWGCSLRQEGCKEKLICCEIVGRGESGFYLEVNLMRKMRKLDEEMSVVGMCWKCILENILLR